MHDVSDQLVEYGVFQNKGLRKKQGDSYGFFSDQFLAVSDGDNQSEHAEIASSEVISEALWGYDLIRRRNFSWHHKDILFKRIFRSVNMHLFHKKQELGFADLRATLTSVYFSDKVIWYGTLGDTRLFLYHGGILVQLNEEDADMSSKVTLLGESRLGAVPLIGREPWEKNDLCVLATDDVVRFMRIDRMQSVLEKARDENLTLDECAQKICEASVENGNTGNATVLLAKYL